MVVRFSDAILSRGAAAGFGQLLCRIPSKELALVSKSVATLAALILHLP